MVVGRATGVLSVGGVQCIMSSGSSDRDPQRAVRSHEVRQVPDKGAGRRQPRRLQGGRPPSG